MEIEEFVSKIVAGMQERKAKRIVTVDMRKLDAPCEWFVICQGDSNVHTTAIAQSVKDFVREEAGEKPFAVDGSEGGSWIAMDYGSVIVHVFLPETRDFYDIEHLWADAVLEEMADLND